MKKRLNEGLKNKQANTRLETQEKVRNAINELREEGYEITTKLLLERTGLSRSTFSKSHVIEVLKEQRVGRFKNTKKVKEKDLNEYISELEKKLLKSQSENEKLQISLDKEIRKNHRIEVDLAEKEDELKTLRGQLMVLYQKASIRGVELD